MKNIIEKVVAKLELQAHLIANGVREIGADIGISNNTEAKIRAEIAASSAAGTNLKTGRTTLKNDRRTLKALTSSGRVFLTSLRDSLKPDFGSRFNDAWVQLGFDGSLEIPRDPVAMLPYLRSAATFLTNNPGYEVALKNLTAARALVLEEGIDDKIDAVAAGETSVRDLKLVKDQKARVLTNRVSGTINEIRQCIGYGDVRWLRFSLNIPGAPERPEVPLNVIAVLIGPNAVSVKWALATRAGHYRVWKKVVGVDEEFINVGSPADLDFTIEGLPAGKTIEIAVSAVNDGGESAKSAVVTIVTA